jgi:hypothetical protein
MGANNALVTIQNDFMPRLEAQQARIAELEAQRNNLMSLAAEANREAQNYYETNEKLLIIIADLQKVVQDSKAYETMLTDGNDESTAPDCDRCNGKGEFVGLRGVVYPCPDCHTSVPEADQLDTNWTSYLDTLASVPESDDTQPVQPLDNVDA